MSIAVWIGVSLLGGLGAVARFVVDRGVARRVGLRFPIGTLAVNVSGAVALGFISGLTLSHDAALLAGTAFVGAYTTFSTWMFETHRLAEERQYWSAAANIGISVALGIAAAISGQWLAGRI